MPLKPVITREIAPLPLRDEDAHKGDVGRLIVIGGCCQDTLMVGAPALAARAAFRSGVGLVQMVVPEPIRASAAILASCATTRTLPADAGGLLRIAEEFKADVAAFGPGIGDSLEATEAVAFLDRFPGPVVVDADGLNLLAAVPGRDISGAERIVLTPHPGEMRRLLSSRNIDWPVSNDPASRREAACALVEATGCNVVLKGRGTVVTNGRRLYVNETGNAGMATGGAGDVLTGIIAGLIGQHLEPFEAAILSVYLHGLAGDFAAEELGRWSMNATDLIEYLPEAFGEHTMSDTA